MSEILRIIVLGANGRMGRTLCRLISDSVDLELAGAVEGLEHMHKLDALPCPVADNLQKLLDKVACDAVIDFTAPQATLGNARIAAERKIPEVIGTTGFDEEQKKELAALARVTPMLVSSNMSVGINVLAEFLPKLAMALGENYDMEICEIHHKRKKDAPSGTALMLGEALASSRGMDLDDCRISCRDGFPGERKTAEIGVMALRGGDVVGIHDCYFLGPGEHIEVRHMAQSRDNFAQGALRAARWLAGQPAGRIYSMRDVIEASFSH